MLIISITEGDKNKDINIPTDWEDMTVDYYCGIFKIINKHQAKSKLKRNVEKGNIIEDLSDDPLEKMDSVDILKMNKDLFQYISKLSDEDIEKVPIEQAIEVLGAISVLAEEFIPKEVDYFDFENERYYFPKEYMKRNTFGDYIEATQLEMSVEKLTNGRFDVLPEQMAILCRKRDEKYDEDLIPEKAEKFRELTMDIVLEFAFFLNKRSVKLGKLLQTYLEERDEVEVV